MKLYLLPRLGFAPTVLSAIPSGISSEVTLHLVIPNAILNGIPASESVDVAQPIQRRGRSEQRTVKKSFTLHEDVVEAVEALVRDGNAENLSAFVEAAIVEQVRRLQRAKRYAAYDRASDDSVFMAEMRVANAELDHVAADGLGDD